MTEPEELHPDDVQHHLKEVQELLARQKVVEDLVHRQDMPRHELVENLVHKQHEAGLRAKLDTLHPADIAYILEALPREERLYVWDLVKAERDGEILLEVSDAVRESLIETMDAGGARRPPPDRSTPTSSPTLPPTCRPRSSRTSSSRSTPRAASSCARRCPTPRTRSAR